MINWLIQKFKQFFPNLITNAPLVSNSSIVSNSSNTIVVLEPQKTNTISPYYPLIILTTVKPIAPYSAGITKHKKGLLEDYFFDYLKRTFPPKLIDENSLIKNNIIIKIENCDIIPDFCYIDTNSDFYLAIEIDEPYALKDNSIVPIHYMSSDDKRNNLLVSNGWNLMRFSERQIAKNPDGCVQTIKNFVEKNNKISVDTQKGWTFDEANEMINNDSRNEYLPIEFKGLANNNNVSTYRSFEISHIFPPLSDNPSCALYIRQTEENQVRQILLSPIDMENLLKRTKPFWDIIQKHKIYPLSSLGLKNSSGFKIEGLGSQKEIFFNFDDTQKIKLSFSQETLEKYDQHWTSFYAKEAKEKEEKESKELEKKKQRADKRNRL